MNNEEKKMESENVKEKTPTSDEEHLSDDSEEAIKELKENLRRLKNAQTSALSNITRKRNELANLMSDENTVHLVKTALEQFDELCTTYQNAHTEHCEAIKD